MEHVIKLTSTSAKDARSEATQFAPCGLRGFSADGECVYISFVRERGSKYPVATARKGDHKIAVRFEAYRSLQVSKTITFATPAQVTGKATHL